MNAKTNLMLAVCLLAAACQKRKYPDEKVQLGTEDIYFNGSLDNQPITLKIGTDGYYCYSSNMQTADSVYVFEGELKKFNCNPCPLSLRLQLSDYRQRAPGSSIPVDSCLRTGTRGFIPGASISFAARSNKETASFLWEASSGETFTDSVMLYNPSKPGPQTVSLTIRTTGNCESMVVNKIFVDEESGLFGCSIAAEPLQNNGSTFNSIIIGGKKPFIYTWSFGDGDISNLKDPTHSYTYAGSYPVKLRIEDAEHHVCESNYIHVAGNDKSSCATNMALYSTNKKSAFFNGVKIQWTDESNKILRSDNVTQPAGSYFEILNSQAYEPNEKGEAGRLLTLRFKVLLSDGTRNIWFKSDNTAIAVSHK